MVVVTIVGVSTNGNSCIMSWRALKICHFCASERPMWCEWLLRRNWTTVAISKDHLWNYRLITQANSMYSGTSVLGVTSSPMENSGNSGSHCIGCCCSRCYRVHQILNKSAVVADCFRAVYLFLMVGPAWLLLWKETGCWDRPALLLSVSCRLCLRTWFSTLDRLDICQPSSVLNAPERNSMFSPLSLSLSFSLQWSEWVENYRGLLSRTRQRCQFPDCCGLQPDVSVLYCLKGFVLSVE